MSTLTYNSSAAIVYDDVLPERDFRALWRHLNTLEAHSVHARSWRKVWRLHDGNPLTSRAGWFLTAGAEGKPNDLLYPLGTPLDHLVAWILDKTPDVASIIGDAGSDWRRMSFAPWIYPPGSGLSLHQDGNLYTGAFTYFAHPEWRVHWGGQLIILDPSTAPMGQQEPDELSPPFLSDDQETARAMCPGHGLVFFAKPNRLVFLPPTVQHLVTRVDPNAGQHARISVAGFFHKR